MLELTAVMAVGQSAGSRLLGTGDYLSWDEGEPSVAAGPVDGLSLVRHFYAVHNATHVWAILRSDPIRTNLLAQAIWPIRRFFGIDATAELAIEQDRESLARDIRIVAFLHTPVEARQAVALLEAFDTEWFLPRLSLAGDRLIFAIGF